MRNIFYKIVNGNYAKPKKHAKKELSKRNVREQKHCCVWNKLKKMWKSNFRRFGIIVLDLNLRFWQFLLLLHQVQHLRSNEAEVAQLRGLTNEQRESINSLTNQIEELKDRLDEETNKLAESLQKIEKITFKYAQWVQRNVPRSYVQK